MTDQPVKCRKIFTYINVPQRVVLSIFGFMAIVNAYTMRLCLNIILPQLVCHQNQTHADGTACNSLWTSRKETTTLKGKFNFDTKFRNRIHITSTTPKPVIPEKVARESYVWSEKVQTIIIASFYVGYVISHVPGGLLAERYGGKWVLSLSILTAAIFTLLTPTAIRMGGPIALIVLRIIIGVGEGPIFPALSTLLAHWVPSTERGKLGVLVLSGSQVGVCVANLFSSLLLQRFEWCWIFYFFGACSIVWFGLFTFFCYSDPNSHPYIGEKEKEYLKHEIKETKSTENLPPTPWKAILMSPPMWALISATIQYDWGQFALVSEVPKILKNIKELSEQSSILINLNASIPYILKWIVSLASGFLSDALINRDILSISSVRKIMTLIAAFGPRIFIGFTNCLCEHSELLPLINCAIGVMGTYYAGIKLTPLDMSPNYAGTLMGIANGIGSITGLVVPFLEDILPAGNWLQEFRALVWVAVTALTTGEVQPFNDPTSQQFGLDKNK